MSDTPRTEAEVNRTDSCPMAGVVTVDANFACQLERELNAANDRIKQLQEYGKASAHLAGVAHSDWQRAREELKQMEKQCGFYADELSKQDARVQSLEALVDAVFYYDRVHLENVGGMSWFDARDKAKKAKP